MTKYLFYLIGALFLTSYSANAQAGGYSMTVGSSPYTEVSASATEVTALYADGGEADIPIGFNFDFEGTTFTTLAVTSDGFASFVAGATSTAGNNLDAGSSTRRPLLAPLWDDNDGNGNGSYAAYELTGTAPNRVLTMEWRHWEWSWNSTDSVVSFQLKLHETSNVIDFTYRWDCHTCITGPDASIGISGVASFLSVTDIGTGNPIASNLTENSSIDTVVTGQVLTFSPPSCVAPNNLTISNLSVGSADLSWDTGGASSWQISYSVIGNPAGSNIINVTSPPPYSLSGLPEGVPLQLFVRDSCGVGDVSTWSTPLVISLPCAPETAPYSTNFDADYDGYDPICWTTYTSAGLAEVSTFGSPFSGAQHLELWGTTTASDTVVAFTPMFTDLTNFTKQIRFHTKTDGTDDTLFIGTMSSISPTATFNFVDTIVFTSTTYNEAIIPFTAANGYNGNDMYIVFAHSNSDGNSIYIDDFYYEVIPPCPKISGITVMDLQTDTIEFSFTTSASTVDIEWGPAGFVQGTGCTGTATVTGNSAVLDNLIDPSCVNPILENTCYDVYVRNNCSSSGNGISIWEGPISVCTPCDVQTLPYTEDFSSNLGCFTVVDGGSSSDTWSWINDHSSNNLGSAGFMIADSDGAGFVDMEEMAISPVIDASSITGVLILEFDQYYRSLFDNADVEVWNGTQWVTVLAQSGADVGSWTAPDHQFIDVTAYANANFQVRFNYYNANYAWYWAIDNFSVQEITCLESSNFSSYASTSNSISLNWNPGDGINWGIEYGPAGFTPGTGTLASTTDTFFVANSLSTFTTYDFYLTDTCSSGNSNTVGPLTFTTPCAKQTIPFTEDFSTDLGCFIVTQNGGSSNDTWQWVADYSTFAGNFTLDGSPGFAFVNSDAAGMGSEMDEIMESPVFDASSLGGALILEFDQYFNANGDTASVDVWDGSQWVNVLKQYTDIGTFGAPNTQIIDVTAYANADFSVRFHYYHSTWDYYWAIDNFSLSTLPCGFPSGLSTTSVLPFSANLAWTSNGSMWNIDWGPAGFTQGSQASGGFSLKGITSNPYTLSGLNANTCYDFYVQDTCAGIGSGSWTGPFQFCTPPSCPEPTNLGVDVSTLTINSADIYWTPGIASHFNLEYGVLGFVRGTGNRLQLTNDTVSLSGLTSGTAYEFYVRDSCSTTDTSAWAGPYSFITPFTTNYLNDFNIPTPLGWTEADGRLSSNTTFTADTSTWGQASFGYFGSPSQRVNIYEDDHYEWLISPSIYLDPSINNLQVEFDVSITEWISTTQGYLGSDDTLALIISTDNGNTWSDANILWYTDANDTMDAAGEHITIPISGYTGYVKFGFYAGSDLDDPEDNDWYIDNFEVRTPRSCPQPSNLGVINSSITISSADIYWTPGSASHFNLEYGVSGFARGTGNRLQLTNDTVSLSGLTSGTAYEFYVRDSCSTTDTSAWAGPYSFITPFTTNYLNDFNIPTPLGWTEADGRLSSNTTFTANTSTWGQASFGYFGSPSQRVNIYEDDHYEWLISPSIYLDPSINNLQVEFDVSITEWTSTTQGYLGSDDTLALIISTDNGNTWSDANILWYTDANDTIDAAGEHVTIPISGYTGYVKFGFYAGSALDDPEDNDWYIDNFEVRTPRACASPTMFAANALSSNSAMVTWTAGTAGFINAEVIYTVGNQPASAGTVVNSTNDTVILNGLASVTTYCVYLVEECALGFSDTIGPVCFSTLCLPQSLPYVENFNASLGCFTAIDGGTTADTWEHVNDYNGSTLDGSPFAFVDSDAAGSGNHLSEILSSVQLDASNVSNPLVLTFDHYFFNLINEEAFVEVFDGTQWNIVAHYTLTEGGFAFPASDSIDITQYANGALQVRFRYEDNNVWGWYWAVDNVRIYEVSCPAPTGVAVVVDDCESVTVNWTSSSSTTSSTLVYGSPGFNPLNGTVITNAVSPYTISGLTMSTDYEVYVIDSCSSDVSFPVGPISFKTDSVGPVMASFTFNQSSVTMNDATVDFDASGSVGDGLTYDWDFGNGTVGTGLNTTGTYTVNGTHPVTLTITDRCGNTDDTTITVAVQGISLTEINYETGLELYPNPSTGSFTVELESLVQGNYNLEVLDMAGKIIERIEGLSTGEAHPIELRNVEAGMYWIRITGSHNINKRLLIE